jgi:2-succinyl-5-enolpyruvyl-6-hydroxy-3-cyclohexene-1-carboxylate synthase
VRHACITPGSRSTPLTLAFAGHPAIGDWSHHDERSSAFFGLGIGKTTGMPAVVVTTSGTAAAELYPAAVEARYARVPLILVTADRPADLRDVGAPQAIDQTKLFGDAVRWAQDLEPSDRWAPGYPAALAARLVAQALGPPPAPVHLNVRFREPLYPPEERATGDLAVPRVAGPGPPLADEAVLDAVAERLLGRRTLVIAGPLDDRRAGPSVAELGSRGGWPVLADPLSQMRAGRHDPGPILAGGDLLAGAGWVERNRPDAVLRIGGLPTSKPLWTWLAAHPGIPQILLDTGGWGDPLATASEIIRADPAATAAALARRADRRAPDDWWLRWAEADDAAHTALEEALAAEPFPTEPGVVRTVVDAVPDGSTLWVASSMPVRDLDLVTPASTRDLRFAANRGANGIDGFLSSGLGAAAAGDRPTYLIAGDVSVLHDATALAAAARLDIDATIVVIDNDGGGIFHFLPQSADARFEQHFGTPHGLDLARIARGFGVPATIVETPAELEAAVAVPPTGPSVWVVRTDRRENVEVHRRIRSAVRAALG